MTIKQYIEKYASENPGKIYLYFKDEEIRFKEFNDNINKRANYLLDLGIERGDRVALYLPNCPEFLYTWLACTKIGAAIVPINTAYKAEETKYVLNHSETKLVVTNKEYLDLVLSIKNDCRYINNIFTVDASSDSNVIVLPEAVKDFPVSNPDVEVGNDDIVSILYTSGTTGPPKGCILPNDYYTITAENHLQFAGITSDDRIITHLPLFHMNAQCIATIPSILSGACLILIEQFSASRFWDQNKKYRPTIFSYIGSILSILEKLPELPGDKTHGIPRCYGGGVGKDQMERFENRFNLKVIEAYGSTEDSTVTSNYYMEGSRKIGSVGVPSPRREVRIVDDEDQDLPPNTRGEIIVKGKPMMKGYFKDAEATAEVMRGGWFHTGDNGYIDDKGFLYFSERKKDIVRRSGENISSVEVETVIKAHPKILDAAVIGVPDEIRGEEVKAYILLRSGHTEKTCPPSEIIAFCQENLAYFKVPRYLEYREKDFPRTPTQRIQKFELKEEKKNLKEGCFDRESSDLSEKG